MKTIFSLDNGIPGRLDAVAATKAFRNLLWCEARRTGLSPHKVVIIDNYINNVLPKSQRKRTMLNKGTKQRLFSLQTPTLGLGCRGQVGDFGACEVCERVHFEIAEGVLDGIKFGSIRRQQHAMDSAGLAHIGCNDFPAVGAQPIPDEHDRRFERSVKLAQKSDNERRIDIDVRVQS